MNRALRKRLLHDNSPDALKVMVGDNARLERERAQLAARVDMLEKVIALQRANGGGDIKLIVDQNATETRLAYSQEQLDAALTAAYDLADAHQERIVAFAIASNNWSSAVTAIDTVVATRLGDARLARPMLEHSGVLLAAAMERIEQTAPPVLKDHGSPDELAMWRTVTQDRLEGIRRYMHYIDDGQSLREAIERNGGTLMRQMLDQRAFLPIGRQRGRTIWRAMLAARWATYQTQHPYADPPEIIDALRNELEDIPKVRRSTEENAMLRNLKSDTALKYPFEYRRKLVGKVTHT